MRLLIALMALAIASAVTAQTVHAQTTAERTSGTMLLDVEHAGEAWYVYPANLQRYYLGRPDDAFAIMRFLGLGITNENLAKIPIATDPSPGNVALRQQVSGRILLQVEEHGEAWYVHPRDQRRSYMGRPWDAFQLMTRLGLGITSADLSTIPIGGSLTQPVMNPERHQSYTMTLSRGSFPIEVVELSRARYRMITDTGNATDCERNCPAQSLAAYAAENGAVHGIHGTYFCPPDYAACAGKTNSYLPPFFNSALDRMVNEDVLPFHAGPMIIEAGDRQLTFFHRTIDFGYTVSAYESRTGREVKAAASNYPSLMEGGSVVVEREPLENGQLTRATRGGIGYTDTTIFLVVAQSASVVDLAYIFDALGATYAINLDGGGSVAMLFNGQYVVGPGRLLPNAILFAPR